MADSKSAGRMAVWVRVPLRVQGRLGALAGSARKGPGPDFCCGERASLWRRLLPSPPRFFGSLGKGGTCCFMCLCVFGVAVCGGCAFRGVASVYNLILARADAFPMVRDSVVASSKDSKRSLRERPTWLVFRDGTELVGFVWFGFSHAVARYAEMVCRVTAPFTIPYLVFACSLIVFGEYCSPI